MQHTSPRKGADISGSFLACKKSPRKGLRLIGMIAVLLSLPYHTAMAEIAFVLNSREDSVSLIDTEKYTEIRRVPIGKEPHHLMITPDNRQLIIANAIGNNLVFVDPLTGNILKRIPRIADPYQIGFSPDGRWFVVNGNRLNHVDIYHYHNGELELAKRLKYRLTPSHLAFSRDSKTVFVTVQETDRLAAIDLTTLQEKWNVATGRTPAGVWITPGQGLILVGITGEDYVQVFDPADGTVLRKIKTGKGAHNFLPMGDARHVLLSNRVDDTISIIDMQTLKVTGTIAVPGGPDDMELRRDGKELWVTARWRNHVAVVNMDTRKIEHIIKVGRSPHGIYFHSHAPRI